MKTKLILLITICVLISGMTFAQGDPHRDPNRKMPSAEEMTKRDMDKLKTELTLTDDQIPFIEKVLLDSYSKMQKLFQSPPPDFSKMAAIMEDRDNDVKMVLTDDQIKKYTELREKQKERFKEGNRNE